MESAFSFAPLRPAGFVNFTGRGGASIPGSYHTGHIEKCVVPTPEK